jgi:hypothetical protein
MCLEDSLESRWKPDAATIGWKIFERVQGFSELYHAETVIGNDPYKEGVWYIATPVPVRDTRGRFYTSGFHAYRDKGAALVHAGDRSNVVVRKVKIRGIRFEGPQAIWGPRGKQTFHCFVARQMMILPGKEQGDED